MLKAKIFEGQTIKCYWEPENHKDLHKIAKINEGHLCLRDACLCFNSNSMIYYAPRVSGITFIMYAEKCSEASKVNKDDRFEMYFDWDESYLLQEAVGGLIVW